MADVQRRQEVARLGAPLLLSCCWRFPFGACFSPNGKSFTTNFEMTPSHLNAEPPTRIRRPGPWPAPMRSHPCPITLAEPPSFADQDCLRRDFVEKLTSSVTEEIRKLDECTRKPGADDLGACLGIHGMEQAKLYSMMEVRRREADEPVHARGSRYDTSPPPPRNQPAVPE